jgi:U4/U6.U5 tri-snRNP component SNU23
MSAPTTKGVANFKRRTWDKSEYERLAIEREDQERSGARTALEKPVDSEEAEDGTAVETKFARFNYADVDAAKPSGSSKAYLDVDRAREKLDLDKHVGKVEKVTGGALKAGFHCELCDRTFQDSLALMDHMNGREHQSRLGFSMQIAQSKKEDVLSKLHAHVRKAALGQAHQMKKAPEHVLTLEERIQMAEREQEREREAKRQKRKKKQNEHVEEEEEEKPVDEEGDMATALGFSSFGN